ncbi:MAG: CRISPR-associated protein Csx3 [Anaerolineae bacterium]
MELFPAVAIGGPPHAGKSVLAYSLSQALRAQDVQHYVLRAYPDGEGDWANEAQQELVRRIRVKDWGSPQWVERISRDILNRHLPLIVDVGGQPTLEQEAILDCCTHLILLYRDEGSRREWKGLARRHGLTLLADLRSELHGEQVLEDQGRTLRGVITGLERGTMASGPTFDALVERLSLLFAYSPEEIRQTHMAQAPVEMVVDLFRLAHALGTEPHRWQPADLPRVLAYLPEGVPLGLYGRGPIWLYAAVASLTSPAPFYQFDVRLGWVGPPALTLGGAHTQGPLHVQVCDRGDHIRLEVSLEGSYLDYTEAQGAAVPAIPPNRGVVLSGKLPLWLWTGLALAYRSAPWVATYQPQHHDQAVVVFSSRRDVRPGDLVASEP